MEDLEKRIQDKESQARERQNSANGLAQERLEIENQLRRARAEANSTQQIIASSQAKIESALSQMEGNKERMKQLEEEAERLRIEQIKAVAERDQFEKLLEEHQKT